jgi:membrane-bound metal-dependent hydrolase YbcI (DUF457 family)
MTLTWVIIIVAVPFLLYRRRLLGRALRVAVIIAVVLIVVMDWMDSYPVDPRWEEPQNNGRARISNAEFAQSNECLNPYTGKVRPVNESGAPWCDSNESIRLRGTPKEPWDNAN